VADVVEAYEKVLERLRDEGYLVVERGSRAVAQCPVHGDRTPSLSITYDEDEGRALMYCHAGCHIKVIMAELGFTWRDLFEDDGTPVPRRDERLLVAYTITRPKLEPVGEDLFAACY
jgi:hypothetical protein